MTENAEKNGVIPLYINSAAMKCVLHAHVQLLGGASCDVHQMDLTTWDTPPMPDE